MYKSHDIFAPGQTVALTPLSQILQSGQISNASKSAARALHVLEFLAMAEMPLRAVDISSALGFSPSSAHQLLQTMVDAAYLILDPITKRYYPSPRIAKLCGREAASCLVYGPIGEMMKAAQQALGLCISITACQGSLSASRGPFMQIIDNVGDNRCFERNGMRAPLFGTSVGAAWLASQSDDAVRSAIHQCRRELGPRANDVAALIKGVNRVRAAGHCFGGITQLECERVLAVALPRCSNGIVLVVCAFGASDDMQNRREDIAATLKDQVRSFFPAGEAAAPAR